MPRTFAVFFQDFNLPADDQAHVVAGVALIEDNGTGRNLIALDVARQGIDVIPVCVGK